MFCRSLFVLLSIFFWLLRCLSFDLQILRYIPALLNCITISSFIVSGLSLSLYQDWVFHCIRIESWILSIILCIFSTDTGFKQINTTHQIQNIIYYVYVWWKIYFSRNYFRDIIRLECKRTPVTLSNTIMKYFKMMLKTLV